MADRSSTKVVVPHPIAPDCPITGILERLSGAGTSTQGRPITLILHGAMGHKDYLFQRRLALKLPLDSFRFDFRGSHETPGTWGQGALDEDLEDLRVVVRHLQEGMGYVVTAVVGHSRGSIVGMRWVCTAPEARGVTTFVNASGRYRMGKILETAGSKAAQAGFDARGYHDWTTTVARKPVTVRLIPSELERFVQFDTSLVWDRFPQSMHVLTIHGLADKTVPPYDAVIYARALGARSPGTHTLHLVDDADHNFTGRQDEIVGYILAWWDLQARGEIKCSGVWDTGTKL